MSTRRAVKTAMFGVCLVVVAPLIVAAWLEKLVSKSEAVFGTLAQLLSWLPGPVGSYLRVAYYYGTLEDCSWEIHVGFGSLFTHRGARLARNVSMGMYCVIGHVSIEHDVRLASRISIPSGKRQHLTDDGELTEETRFDRVKIGSGSWIGEGAIVLADVGPGSIVSAGAVVVNDVPTASIVGGNPARVIKTMTSADAEPQ
jgi:virginiamycin A acetyltransferase